MKYTFKNRPKWAKSLNARLWRHLVDVKDNDFDARNIGADSPFERVILDSQEMANG